MSGSQGTSRPLVYVLDDDSTMREFIAFALRHHGYDVVTFGNGADFLAAREPAQTGCAILDLHMPGLSGLEIHTRLIQQHDPLPVIMISGEGDIPTAVTSIQRGAIDWLVKPFTPEALLRSVEKALKIEKELRERMERAREATERLDRLTGREREVLALIIAGYPNKNIADELKLSERTIEYHRGNLMNKLGVHSVPELMNVIFEMRPHAPPEAG